LDRRVFHKLLESKESSIGVATDIRTLGVLGNPSQWGKASSLTPEHGLSNPELAAIYSSVLPTAPKPEASSEGDKTRVYRSPLAGLAVGLPAKPGDRVQVNDLLLVLDARKMEIETNTQSAGIVKAIEVSPNDAVRPDQVRPLGIGEPIPPDLIADPPQNFFPNLLLP
jgi:biotin carboxyl carrier protein